MEWQQMLTLSGGITRNVSVCVCVYATCAHMHSHIYAQSPFLLPVGDRLLLFSASCSRLFGPWVPRDSPLPNSHFPLGALRLQALMICIWLLYSFWGFKLRFSYLHDQHYSPPSHLHNSTSRFCHPLYEVIHSNVFMMNGSIFIIRKKSWRMLCFQHSRKGIISGLSTRGNVSLPSFHTHQQATGLMCVLPTHLWWQQVLAGRHLCLRRYLSH